ncbi:MAG: potassium channel protein [Planctomycetes bacterium]|nr:potassium channel protein [Planctomycetota bacterium]
MSDRSRRLPLHNPHDEVIRRLRRAVLMLLAIASFGTVGFKFFAQNPDVSWVDCMYMTVTTMTTVGYGEIVELGQGGRVFVVTFLIACFGLISIGAVEIGQWVFSAEAKYFLERRRMERKIQHLKDHFIVCGFGRMGWTICENLARRGRQFVVIDVDEKLLQTHCTEQGWLFVVGDASDDRVLAQAGISRAKALAAVLPTDAENVYVTLTARLLSGRLDIIARASEESATLKLERAGANRVVSPYSTGAQKIARFMLNPNIEDFLEIADHKGQDLELADVQVSARSPYVGKKLMETNMRESGVMIVGIRRRGGERLMPPPGNAIIEAGDCLYAFGSSEGVNRMINQASQVVDDHSDASAGGQSGEFTNLGTDFRSVE